MTSTSTQILQTPWYLHRFSVFLPFQPLRLQQLPRPPQQQTTQQPLQQQLWKNGQASQNLSMSQVLALLGSCGPAAAQLSPKCRNLPLGFALLRGLGQRGPVFAQLLLHLRRRLLLERAVSRTESVGKLSHCSAMIPCRLGDERWSEAGQLSGMTAEKRRMVNRRAKLPKGQSA